MVPLEILDKIHIPFTLLFLVFAVLIAFYLEDQTTY